MQRDSNVPLFFFTRLQNTSQIDSSLSEVFRKRVRTLRRSPRMLRDMASGLSQISSMTSDITAWAFKLRDLSFDAAESPEEVTGALSERAHGGSPSYIAFITNHGAAAAPPRVACDEGNISHRGVFRKIKNKKRTRDRYTSHQWCIGSQFVVQGSCPNLRLLLAVWSGNIFVDGHNCQTTFFYVRAFCICVF